MSGQKRTLRNVVALGASALVHLLALAVFLIQGAAQYQLPEPETPPMEVEIMPRMEVIPPPEATPPIPKATPERQTVAPVAPTTSRIQPVTPQPTPPQPTAVPTPAPPRITLERPIQAAPAAPKAPLVAKPSPSAALSATPVPTLAPAPTPAPATPAPARPTAAPAASTAPAPVAPRLNIHKSEKDAPAGTPTLPMAPSSAPPPAGGGRPAGAAGGGAGEAGIGGSRLQGLVPYPPGSMPSGGSGLRGSLVGCANAQAVGLSSVERAHCESRFGANGANAPHLDGIAPDKRAAFDRAADSGERDRAYRGATSGPARWTVAPGGGNAGGLPSSMSPLKPSSPNGSGP